MAEKFTEQFEAQLLNGIVVKYSWRKSDGGNPNAVARCSVCNKFFSWVKFSDNNWRCPHCG